VNWADLHVVEVEKCESDTGDITYKITITEASRDADTFAIYIQDYIENKLRDGNRVTVCPEW
jgi:hypothetical protein